VPTAAYGPTAGIGAPAPFRTCGAPRVGDEYAVVHRVDLHEVAALAPTLAKWAHSHKDPAGAERHKKIDGRIRGAAGENE
jgi:hypothetical protein